MRKLILILPLLLVGCAQPKTLTRTELDELKLHRQEPKVNMWYYTGSKDGYHYFHQDDLGAPKDFRILESELSWTNTFPMTHSREKWRHLDWGQPQLPHA
jgi:basic membrane lipoprotein Med (substrate-binding protein (PBP1-ABC) superfamily)